jgi:hypothetical protein
MDLSRTGNMTRVIEEDPKRGQCVQILDGHTWSGRDTPMQTLVTHDHVFLIHD